jgi:hypothetical protein
MGVKMNTQIPENLSELSLEDIRTIKADALAEATELNAIADDQLTDEQYADIVALADFLAVADEREQELVTEAQERTDKLAAARGKIGEASTPVEDPEDDEDPEGDEPDEDGEPEEAEDKEKELVTASATPRRSAVRKARSAVVEPEVDEQEEDAPRRGLSLIAAANVPSVTAGTEFKDMGELAKAFDSRMKAFAGGGARAGKALPQKAGVYGLDPSAQRFSVAKLYRPESEFTLTAGMSTQQQYETIMAAASEKRLEGGSILAAGGWCAPSEQVWGFCELEEADALLDVPEVNAPRGGIQFTKGPTLEELLADADFGFDYTETELEANPTKPCYVIECPDWDEVRVDAVGFCIKANIPANAAYPELTRRVLSLGTVAHARKINAKKVAAILAATGATINYVELGSLASDVLDAMVIQALHIRYTHSMGENAVIEAFAPLWLKEILRADLGRRTGMAELAVTDAQIASWFAVRRIRVQFIRDFDDLNSSAITVAGGTAGWTTWPDKVRVVMYPAGAYVALGLDVIDVDAVYDSAGLAANQFTAAFFEEGVAVANTCGTGFNVTIGLTGLSRPIGATGVAAVGGGAGINFAAAA